MERKFTTESFDKFSNSKTISTLRKKKFGGWTETHEADQSLMLYKNDMIMPSMNVDIRVRLFASIVHSSTPTNEDIYIELLNYYENGYADKGSNEQDFSNTTLDVIIDNENTSIKAEIINNGERRFAKSGLVNKDIFTREQLLKYSFTNEQFEKFCSGKNIFIRISGVQNSVRLSHNDKNIHELDNNTVKSLQIISKQFYNEVIHSGRYIIDQDSLLLDSNSSKKHGCFIATAAMGGYNHPVVKDLRLFRDNWLLKRKWGVSFTAWYYIHGPKAASIIEKSVFLKKMTFFLVIKPLQMLTKIIRNNG